MCETCVVCRQGKGPEKCEVCGFSDDGFINRSFPIREDAENWLETIVKPYRAQWEKAELLAQLEEAKKQKAELLAQLEAAKSNAVLYQPPASNTFTDPRDGKVYRTVKIGNQVWMAENLNFETKVRGIFGISRSEGSRGYNDPKNANKYGRLYNWDTTNQACPPGWHLPSKEEWQTLVNFVGGEKIAEKKLKAKSGWTYASLAQGRTINSSGTDDFGFSALPCGFGRPVGSDYVGYGGFWWSSSSEYICIDPFEINYGRGAKGFFYSVRCLQN